MPPKADPCLGPTSVTCNTIILVVRCSLSGVHSTGYTFYLVRLLVTNNTDHVSGVGGQTQGQVQGGAGHPLPLPVAY